MARLAGADRLLPERNRLIDAGSSRTGGLGDGWLDLTLKFATRDVAAAIGTRGVGDAVPLTLTGSYMDELSFSTGGMPFEAPDFVTVVGNHLGGAGVEPVTDEAVLGLANPNPFNPVTRISDFLPTAANVR